jgi:hypothetical protein
MIDGLHLAFGGDVARGSFNTTHSVVDQVIPVTMPHFTDPSTPAATITTLDEKLTDADTTAPARFLHDHHLTSETLPFWLVNLPRSRWTAECPDFLRDQPPKNIRCLSTPDDHYARQNWGKVKEIISESTCSLP